MVPYKSTGPHAACTPVVRILIDENIKSYRAGAGGRVKWNRHTPERRSYPKKLVPHSPLILFVHSLVDLVYTSERHLWMDIL